MTNSPSKPLAAGLDSHRAPYKKSVIGIAAVLLLVITFWLYAKPDVIIMLAEQMWSCF